MNSLPSQDITKQDITRQDITKNDNEKDLSIIEGSIPTIVLLEEQLRVYRHRQRIGEIVVRKEVETRVIEIPIRREKLIIEQVEPEYKQIAVVDLGNDSQLNGLEESLGYFEPVFKGEFKSVKSAIQFLNAIASLPDKGISIRIEIKVEDALVPETYQKLLESFVN
jgi:hypothetical protein